MLTQNKGYQSIFRTVDPMVHFTKSKCISESFRMCNLPLSFEFDTRIKLFFCAATSFFFITSGYYVASTILVLIVNKSIC